MSILLTADAMSRYLLRKCVDRECLSMLRILFDNRLLATLTTSSCSTASTVLDITV